MIEINNLTKQRINRRQVERVAESFLKKYRKSGWSVSVALVGPGRMRRLNRDYRGIDRTTDVLSFPSSGPSGEKYWGEVVINLAETKRAEKYLEVLGRRESQSFTLLFLLVHGLLHLAGYEDKTEAGRLAMIRRGESFLVPLLKNPR